MTTTSVTTPKKFELVLDGESLCAEDLVTLSKGATKISLSEEAWKRVSCGREVVDNILKDKTRVAYGINTGFGLFSNVIIGPEKLTELQENLIRSHSSGTGEPLSPEQTRMLLALRINVLAKGHSGIRVYTLKQLVSAFNADCLSVVPSKGTVGASGDLAPLAHLALGMMGEGPMWDKIGEQFVISEASKVLAKNGLKPVKPEPEIEQPKAEHEITDLDDAKQEIKRLKALVEQKQKPVEHPAAGMKRTSDTFYRGGGGFVISGGNFHGEYPAKVLDYLAIGIHEIASVSERRIERLVNPTLSNLPAFLVPEGGLNSGFMIAHCTAAALVSENKVLTHPSSVDSISTSGAKEDHVSMGGFAARKALTVVEHVETVVAIEILAACQALDLLRPLRTTEALETVHALVRTRVARFDKDRVMKPDIDAVLDLVRSGAICEAVAPFLSKPHEPEL
uniref:Histidine ammonia-lyase n=1 Tax=Phytophthora ramorum TaxID=164328 RepID=H3GED5_PHYRM